MTADPSREQAALRPVERADLLSVVHIEERTFERPWTLATFEEFLDAPGFLVLEDPFEEDIGKTLAGYVVAETVIARGRRFGHVKDLAVKPERQGAGRGRRLLLSALSVLANQGAGQARLEVRPSNDAALALYESTDFEIVGRKQGYYENGEDALIMARSLASGAGVG